MALWAIRLTSCFFRLMHLHVDQSNKNDQFNVILQVSGEAERGDKIGDVLKTYKTPAGEAVIMRKKARGRSHCISVGHNWEKLTISLGATPTFNEVITDEEVRAKIAKAFAAAMTLVYQLNIVKKYIKENGEFSAIEATAVFTEDINTIPLTRESMETSGLTKTRRATPSYTSALNVDASPDAMFFYIFAGIVQWSKSMKVKDKEALLRVLLRQLEQFADVHPNWTEERQCLVLRHHQQLQRLLRVAESDPGLLPNTPSLLTEVLQVDQDLSFLMDKAGLDPNANFEMNLTTTRGPFHIGRNYLRFILTGNTGNVLGGRKCRDEGLGIFAPVEHPMMPGVMSTVGAEARRKPEKQHQDLPFLMVPKDSRCHRCPHVFTQAIPARIRVVHNKKRGKTNWTCTIRCPRCCTKRGKRYQIKNALELIFEGQLHLLPAFKANMDERGKRDVAAYKQALTAGKQP